MIPMNPRYAILFIVLVTGAMMTHSLIADKDGTRPELGTVKWGRDMDAAIEASKDSGKPVFALFQEVPG